jgi:hypothetical protein
VGEELAQRAVIRVNRGAGPSGMVLDVRLAGDPVVPLQQRRIAGHGKRGRRHLHDGEEKRDQTTGERDGAHGDGYPRVVVEFTGVTAAANS